LWDLAGGRLYRTLAGHLRTVWCVAFDSAGGVLASGGADKMVMLWDPTSGKIIRTLGTGSTWFNSIAFDPSGRTLASWTGGQNIMLWDTASGKLLRTIEGHRESVFNVAFDSSGHTLASGSQDSTVRLWDVDSGKLLRTLEGHTSFVRAVCFSPDGRCLVSQSGGNSGSFRIWNIEDGSCVATISEPADDKWPPGIAFHPRTPLLATVGSDSGAPEVERDCVIHIWKLDFAVLLDQPAKPMVTYTSAKVVLVGESNVGKSYLAHRIATGTAPEEGTIKSTHGMKFWPLEPDEANQNEKTTGEKHKEGVSFAEILFGQIAADNKRQRRDIVLWDMGGQEEYRLIHQLFLHDTTVALVLLDPTRSSTAFKEVEAWNKSLERQLGGRAAVKLLVGSKVDQPSELINRQSLERLCQECGFVNYVETSALTGRGVAELCEAVAKAIKWDMLGKTSRPELFQRIRDEIEGRRKRGEVILPLPELIRSQTALNKVDGEEDAVNAVTAQLAAQGVISRSKVSTGEPVLVLQVQEIERYAGSLILAARNNPRGVPALELRAIAQEDFSLPGIIKAERLPREQEKPVLECTVQLMLEHGICFQHEGLLIFPSLFAIAPETSDGKMPHAVSLYYDFAGAIDNIYASLVAWLVLAKAFGKVRLWSDRAEFELKDGGLCGLLKRGRPGGFAHVDLYFEVETPDHQQKVFISFVEDHLARNGVEICEHVAIKCACGHEFAEETLRQRIARGDKDVVCPVCETRHNLIEGAAHSRERDPMIADHTWALRTQIEKLRETMTQQVIQELTKAEEAKHERGTIRLLHLSDLHFTKDTPVQARMQWLLDDIKQDSGLNFKELDYLVISGDFTDKACTEGFEKAYEFVSGLTQEFGLSAERCIFVPGNHDAVDHLDAYKRCKDSTGLREGEWFQEGKLVMARDPKKYPLRFKPFSDSFYHKFLQRPYPASYVEQGAAIPFWETGIQFLTLNSCWQIDEFFRKRSGVHVEAVANAIKQAQKQEAYAREVGQLKDGVPVLRIAVWHHAVAGPEQMKDPDFLGNLHKNDVRLILHGDVHAMQREVIGYRHVKNVHVVGSGSFGASGIDQPESTPRLYNVLEITRDLKSARVHTRCQPKPDGPWDGWHEWPDPDGGKGRLAYYDIKM
jgi:small GTP-binding protein